MLNLSPIGHEEAKRQAFDEASELLNPDADVTGLRKLLGAIRELQALWKGALGKIADEINGLVGIVERALESRDFRSAKVRTAVAALAYLRNPYDRIFDLHVEAGFMDDREVIAEAWRSIAKGDTSMFIGGS